MSLITAPHHLGRDTFHHVWDRDLAPELVVKPGDEVSLGLRDPSDYQITAAKAPTGCARRNTRTR